MTENIKTCFYDIESLVNIFTNALWWPYKNHIDIFYLDDDNLIQGNWEYFTTNLRPRILKANKNLDPSVTMTVHNLEYEQANRLFARIFGLWDNKDDHYTLMTDPGNPAKLTEGPGIRPVMDIETEKEGHDLYLLGYNSFNYDTTMIAQYMYESYPAAYGQMQREGRGKTYPCCRFMKTSARQMRQFNDELFTEQFKAQMPRRLIYGGFDIHNRQFAKKDWNALPHRIRKAMIQTGRHIDVARLNEKQQKVALKRNLGMQGYQILESSLLRGKKRLTSIDHVIDLMAYNISDVVNLEKLAKHPAYASAFQLKKNMLEEYPELIFNKKPDDYAPDVYIPGTNATPNIRKDRLSIDSSSAQFSTNSLCPYGHLDDTEAVSFLYPSSRKAKEMGIAQFDVLEESDKFFRKHFKKFPHIMDEWQDIYNFYAAIRGKNFNKGENYQNKYPNHPVYSLEALSEEINTNLFYYHANGTKSRCYVTFSTGGIHGQEVNMELYERDMEAYYTLERHLGIAKSLYPKPTDLAKAKTIEIEGITYKAAKFLKPKSNMTKGEYKDCITKKLPSIIERTSKGNYKLCNKYAFTSSGCMNHNDFKSYYPLLLIMLDAFYNPSLGYDRYHSMYEAKEEYGIKSKEAEKKDDHKRANMYTLLRNGVKLVVNSASGAGDTDFSSKIQMNNRIISMRIIGQLFAWRVGQEQALHGAIVPSTNTDGLYTILDQKVNDEIVARLKTLIHVDIEPERMFLISKDTNNRIELSEDKTKVFGAGGGSLACRKGPDPHYALSHPAIIDFCLGEYMIRYGVESIFDDAKGLELLKNYDSLKDKEKGMQREKLIMFQNVLASSPGMRRFIYGERNPIDSSIWTPGHEEQPVILQHYNRFFYLSNKTENTMHLKVASAKKITPAMLRKRREADEPRVQNDQLAAKVLLENDADVPKPHEDHEACVGKINGIGETWNALVINSDIHMMREADKQALYDNLDFDAYLFMLRDAYESNWRNIGCKPKS